MKMSKERQLFPANEAQVADEHLEVINGLQNSRGETIGQDLIRSLVEGTYSRIVFLGRPNSGKSTACGQFIEAAQRRARYRRPVQVIYTSYEKTLEEFEQEIGLPHGMWTREDWTAKFNPYLVQKILQFSKDIPSQIKAINIVEMPGIRSPWPIDRGETALEMLARIDPVNTKYIYLPANQQIEKESTQLRIAIEDKEDKEVVRFLKENRKIPIKFSSEEGRVQLYAETAEDGRIIKEIFSKTARENQSAAIKRANEDIWYRWKEENSLSGFKIGEIRVPESYYNISLEHDLAQMIRIEDYKSILHSICALEAAWAEDRFSNLGLPSQNGIVAFTPNLSDRNVLLFLGPLQQAES